MDKIAIIFGENKVKYDEIFNFIEKIKIAINIENGSRVIICSENRPQWIYTLFAIWEKNAIAVPVDYLSTPEEISHIIKDSEPSLIFHSKNTENNILKAISLSNYSEKSICFDDIDINLEDLEIKNRDSLKIDKYNNEDIALLLYTSGTTGLPKGVMLTFGNLKSNISCIDKASIAYPKDKVLLVLPLHHSYPLMISLVCLHIGATLVLLEKVNKEEIFLNLNRHNIDLFVGVPRIYELFHKNIRERLNSSFLLRIIFKSASFLPNINFRRLIFASLHRKFGGKIRYFISGGAKLNPDIIRDFETIGFEFLEGYGLTETSPVISFNRPDAKKVGSVGKVLDGVEVKIVDDEILVKGKNVMKGYWRNEEKTKDTFSGDWLRTGDTGFLDKEGFLYITGRKKDIIVLSTGKNINPEDIENQILNISPFIKEVAVVSENDDRLKALIYPDIEAFKREKILNINEKIKWDIIDAYNRTAPSYRKISGFEILKEELPKTRLGKIKRFLLITKKEENKKIETKSVENEPNDDDYILIKKFLQGITNEKIMPSSHIEIDLSLDSLDKVELLSFIESRFGIEIQEENLSEIQVVGDLYKFVKQRKKDISREVEISWSKILNEEINLQLIDNNFYIIVLKNILKPFFKNYFKLKISGIENIPNFHCIIAPNHQSYLDAFLIISTLPKEILKDTYFIASDVCFETKLRKWIAKRFHTIVMNKDTNLRESLVKSANILKRNKSLVIFPEGVITRDGNIGEFKPAFAILSKEFNIPILPVRIKGLFELYRIHEMKFPRRGNISISFLNPVYPVNKSIDEILNETYELIQNS